MWSEPRSVPRTAKIPNIKILGRETLMQLDFKIRVILHPLTNAITDQYDALRLLWSKALRHQLGSADQDK